MHGSNMPIEIQGSCRVKLWLNICISGCARNPENANRQNDDTNTCIYIPYLFWCNISPEDFYPENKEVKFTSNS